MKQATKTPRTKVHNTFDAAASGEPARLARILVSAAILCGAIGGAAWGMYRWSQTRNCNWIIERGRELILTHGSADEQAASIGRWRDQTRPRWPSSEGALIDAMYAAGPAESPAVRAMLESIARIQFGPRREDWQRWYRNRDALDAGEVPSVPRSERVTLKSRWTAPVGLTAWFSTILAMDGKVYVASLGEAASDPTDIADGIVCVDGSSGQSELWRAPPMDGLRDVIGISSGDQRLFGLCRNGRVYACDLHGQVIWVQQAGNVGLGPPLSMNVDRDSSPDVVVAVEDCRVVALNGDNGQPLWQTSPLANGAKGLGAVLSSSSSLVWVTWPDGQVVALDARNGARRAELRLESGSLGGVVLTPERGLTAGWVGDRRGRIWSLHRQDRTGWQLLPCSPPGRAELELWAGPRTLRTEDALPLVVSAPTGPYRGNRASVWAVHGSETRWRVPISGAVTASLLIANLNSTPAAELVIATMQPEDDGVSGALHVYSNRGHLLAMRKLPAPVECTPVLADVTGDQKLDLLLADQAGRLHCFETRAAGVVEWGSCGGDPHNTHNTLNAFSFGQRVNGMQWNWTPED